MTVKRKRTSPLGNQSGMTLVEVLASITISLICTAAFLQLSLSNQQHRTEIDRTIALKELLTNNVIEMKSRPVASVPAAGQCLFRLYDLQARFVSEKTEPAQGNGTCKADTLAQDRIQVTWQVQAPKPSDADFSNPSLKLPQFSQAMKKVTLFVRGYARSGGGALITNQVTLFKR